MSIVRAFDNGGTLSLNMWTWFDGSPIPPERFPDVETNFYNEDNELTHTYWVDYGDTDEDAFQSYGGNWIVYDPRIGVGNIYETGNIDGGNAVRWKMMAGDDRVIGTDFSDRVWSGNGKDHVTGGAGHDRIITGGAADIAKGGAGNDSIDAGWGADKIWGGTGNDFIAAGKGADILHFNKWTGDDVISDYEAGVDTIRIKGLTIADVDISANPEGGRAGGTEYLIEWTEGPGGAIRVYGDNLDINDLLFV